MMMMMKRTRRRRRSIVEGRDVEGTNQYCARVSIRKQFKSALFNCFHEQMGLDLLDHLEALESLAAAN